MRCVYMGTYHNEYEHIELVLIEHLARRASMPRDSIHKNTQMKRLTK